MSCNAAAVGEVTRPTVSGNAGSGLFALGIEQAFRVQLALERLEPRLERARARAPARGATMSWYWPRAS